MSKITVFNKDIDASLAQQLNPIVYLPKIAAPFTTVVKRAQCTDFSNDLMPRFGIDRVMTQAIQEVQGESGPNGERVFKPVNDVHDAVRFVGEFSLQVDVNGQHIDASGSTHFVEITFYGTGLNILTRTNASTTAAVDGGAAGANFMPASLSNVLDGRSVSWNGVVNAVSGLTLGLHTVKIQSASAFRFYGYEVLNTNSTLQQTAGTSYLGGKRLYNSALSTSSPTNSFTNTYGTAGTRGGHVLVYQKADGSIAKDIRYTETAQLNLTSASHTNEDVIRTYSWREFGAGRSSPADDFSTLTSAAASDRAFTLDDGTTTLVGKNAVVSTTTADAYTMNTDGAGFSTFTFVGTGLDISWVSPTAGTNGATAWEVFIDGTSAGYWDITAAANVLKIKTICSGLPYGTHTVKIARNTVSTWGLAIRSFIVYGPSKPALPAGCVELADYYTMADFAATTFGVDVVPSGVLRKFTIREWVYAGAGFTVTTLQPTSNPGGWAVRSATIGETYSYTFFGTGFDLTGHGSTGTASGTISIDGSLYTGSATATNTATWTPGTSTFTFTSAAVEGRVRVTGLSLGLHKVTLTVAAAQSLNLPYIDIITPIHAVKGNLPGDIQNTQNVGSCAISDNRKFSTTSVKTLANWAQAVGVANSPSTTSTSFVPCPDLSVTIKTNGNPINISYYMSTLWAPIGVAPPTGETTIYVDGVKVSQGCLTSNTATLIYENLSEAIIIPVSAGLHKVDVYWKTQNAANTLYCQNAYRCLTVAEK